MLIKVIPLTQAENDQYSAYARTRGRSPIDPNGQPFITARTESGILLHVREADVQLEPGETLEPTYL